MHRGCVKMEWKLFFLVVNFIVQVIPQIISISMSIVSIAWSMRTCFMSEDGGLLIEESPPYTVALYYFIWQISLLGSRILCISIMLSYDSKSTITMLIIHWILMTVWMLLFPIKNNIKRSVTPRSTFFKFFLIFGRSGILKKIFLRVIWGLACIFTISTKEFMITTNYRVYFIYYSIVYLETIIATIILARSSNDYWQNLLYLKSTMMLYLINGLLSVSLIFMLIYVKFCRKYGKETYNSNHLDILNKKLGFIKEIINNYVDLVYYLLPRKNEDMNNTNTVKDLYAEQVLLIENIKLILTTVIIPNYFGLFLTRQSCGRDDCQICDDKIHKEIDRYDPHVQELRFNKRDRDKKLVLPYCPNSPDNHIILKYMQCSERDKLHIKLKVLQDHCKWLRKRGIRNDNQYDSSRNLFLNLKPLDLEQETHEFAELHKKVVDLVQKTMFMYNLVTFNHFNLIKITPKLLRCHSDSSLCIKIARTNNFAALLTLGTKVKRKLPRCLSDSSLYIKIAKTNYLVALLTKFRPKLRRCRSDLSLYKNNKYQLFGRFIDIRH